MSQVLFAEVCNMMLLFFIPPVILRFNNVLPNKLHVTVAEGFILLFNNDYK